MWLDYPCPRGFANGFELHQRKSFKTLANRLRSPQKVNRQYVKNNSNWQFLEFELQFEVWKPL